MRKVILFLVLILPLAVFAQTFPFEVSYPRLGPFSLPPLPTVVEDPGFYIHYLYQVGLIAGVVLAFFSLVFGGLLFLFSAGNISRQMEARERIFGALTGLLLLLASFLILRTIRPEFTRIQLQRPKFPFVEIEEGVWLCPEEIEETYRLGNRNYVLTFEVYIQSREVIKHNWKYLSLEEQRAIHNLYYRVHSNCHLVLVSQEIPENFRRAQHIYIIGNYGAIFHRFPNFKGPYTLITVNRRLFNFDTFSPYAQSQLGEFSHFSLDSNQIPNFSVTLFRDFRLNYLNHLVWERVGGLYPHQPHMDEYAPGGTITFYTFRNFHEDLATQFQRPGSTCPSLRDPGTQECFKSYDFRIEDFATLDRQSFNVRDEENNPITVNFWVGNLFLRYIGTITNGQISDGVELDSCYSLRIEPPQLPQYQGQSWWIVIVRGYPRTSTPPPPNLPYWMWAMGQPHLWGEAFDKNDRNFEDNYVSYFCEDKARQKRYPCVGTAVVLPGKIIKEVER